MKDIRYSSRTRQITDQMHREKKLRRLITRLVDDLPDDAPKKSDYLDAIKALGDDKRYNVIHLIYRNKPYEKHFKDFQFSLPTMRERWADGLRDMRATLQHADYLAMPSNENGFTTHDIHRDELKAAMASADSGRGPSI